MFRKLPAGRAAFATGLALSALLLANCSEETASKPTDNSLYSRLGGTPAIASVIDTFLVAVLADTVINERFNTLPAARVASLRQNLIDQVCAGSGGPCVYTGRNMFEAHKGMNISEAEFNALVGDLVFSLDRHKVPEKEKGELLGVLGPMKTDIVGK